MRWLEKNDVELSSTLPYMRARSLHSDAQCARYTKRRTGSTIRHDLPAICKRLSPPSEARRGLEEPTENEVFFLFLVKGSERGTAEYGREGVRKAGSRSEGGIEKETDEGRDIGWWIESGARGGRVLVFGGEEQRRAAPALPVWSSRVARLPTARLVWVCLDINLDST